jgi:hypothetical protein
MERQFSSRHGIHSARINQALLWQETAYGLAQFLRWPHSELDHRSVCDGTPNCVGQHEDKQCSLSSIRLFNSNHTDFCWGTR